MGWVLEPETKEKNTEQQYGSTGFVAKWTILIMCGLLFVFLARIIDHQGNPFNFFTPAVALLGGITSVILIVIGYFIFTRGCAIPHAMTKRNGIMTIVLGVCMLVGHFVFNMVVSLILK